MADNIGVLGTQNTLTVGTHTAYTVPAAKGARVRLMYVGISGTNSTLSIGINGMTVFTTAALTNAHSQWSTTLVLINSNAAAPTGSSTAQTVAPYTTEYLLSAGDTVTYTIGTAAFTAMNFQVVGVEVDV